MVKRTKKAKKRAKKRKSGVRGISIVDKHKAKGGKVSTFTGKQQALCEEFIIDLDIKAAAVRANICYGYARQLLTKSNILNEIQRLKAERSERTQIKADDVVLELAKIGFSNIEDYLTVDEDGETHLKSFEDIERNLLAAVGSIKISTTKNKDDSREYITTQFKLHNKLNALEQLGKHLGIYDKDNAQRMQPFILIFNHKSKEVVCNQF